MSNVSSRERGLVKECDTWINCQRELEALEETAAQRVELRARNKQCRAERRTCRQLFYAAFRQRVFARMWILYLVVVFGGLMFLGGACGSAISQWIGAAQ